MKKQAIGNSEGASLENLPDGVLLHILSFLTAPDLARMHLVCSIFSIRKLQGVRPPATRLDPEPRREQHTIVHGAAKVQLLRCVERDPLLTVPHRADEWLLMLHRIERRGFAIFDASKYHVSADGCTATLVSRSDGRFSAGCSGVMKFGTHYAEFHLVGRAGGPLNDGFDLVNIGVAHAGYDLLQRVDTNRGHITEEGEALYALGSAFYHPIDGMCYQSKATDEHFHEETEPYESYEKDWTGREKTIAGFVIGLQLDLEAGTITVYKSTAQVANEEFRWASAEMRTMRRLGVMATEVKSPVRWAITHGLGWDNTTVEILRVSE